MTPLATLALAFAALPALPPGAGELELEAFVLQNELEVSESSGWAFEIQPYIWLPGADVEAKINSISPSPKSKNISGLFDDLEPSWMLGFEAAPKHGRWGLMFDFSYVDVTAKGGVEQIESNQTFLEADGYIRLPDLAETDIYAGLRFMQLDNRVTDSMGVTESDDALLVDPLIGARTNIPIGKKWAFHIEGDVGGFGVGTNLTWQGLFGFTYALGDSDGKLDIAWRYLDIDYDKDHIIDARFSGLALGLRWGF